MGQTQNRRRKCVNARNAPKIGRRSMCMSGWTSVTIMGITSTSAKKKKKHEDEWKKKKEAEKKNNTAE